MESADRKRMIKGILIIILILILIKVVIFVIPHERSFTSVYYMRSASDNDVFVLGKDFSNSYVARTGHHACYIDSNEDIEDTDYPNEIIFFTYPIGIRIYSLDMMGVWVRYPVIVYACRTKDQ